MWTPACVASRWVRGEARLGAERGILVPVRFERAQLPIDAMAIHTTDLDDWKEDAKSARVSGPARRAVAASEGRCRVRRPRPSGALDLRAAFRQYER